ncbi:Bug family tripartite tricarboxylate transporter substrate binding protein [Aquincola tertiaricarbonis]|uniref:Bug family tripartite tricarboxylate transporter substrate binding protein n=1 Tax=Aquincola tertiaricarbonis TaxID=391953 RepID=UPI0006962BB9|nr:tripartite tricarboxylate transporter substrate binding protein [Aquincola tertiaricarbonis]
MIRRRCWLAAPLLRWPLPAWLGAVTGPSAAADWPTGPLQLVVAYPPGGVSDAAARALAERLSARLNVPVLVTHRAGAGGALALAALARAAPDGHTLCFSAISPLTTPDSQAGGGAALRAQLAPVMSVMATPVLVAGTTALPGEGFEALLAAARRPQGLRWATSGPQTVGHRVLEAVEAVAGGRITHVPYKGGGQQLTDALGAQFEVLSTNVGPLQLGHLRSGRLKALAVGAPARLPVLPEVPTLAELGVPRANLVSLFGIFAPGRTPPAVLGRLNAELNAALQSADLRAALQAADNLPTGGSAEDFGRRIEEEARARGQPQR